MSPQSGWPGDDGVPPASGGVIRKEFLELRQDPRLAAVVIVAPILQLTMLGYAATTDIRNVPIVIVDGDRSSSSRALFERFSGSRYFEIVDEYLDPADAGHALESGAAWLAIVVPPGFGNSVLGAGPATSRTVQILADGTDANSSGQALAYAGGLIAEFNGALVEEVMGARPPRIRAETRVWYNPEDRSALLRTIPRQDRPPESWDQQEGERAGPRLSAARSAV